MSLKPRRVLFLFVLMAIAAAFVMACSGGGGGDDSGDDGSGDPTLDNEVPSLEGKSQAQDAFTETRGNPAMFTVGFVDEEVVNGLVQPAAVQRRIDTWTYNDANGLKSSTFDNGFFVKETNFGEASPLIVPTPLRPDQFVPGMGRAQIVALLGEPSCEQAYELAGKSYVAMRYNPTAGRPATSVGVEEGKVIAVTSGYAITEVPSNDLCQQ